MIQGAEEQTSQWLKKLEKESWQLELLVSAFTIFLLIAADRGFADFLSGFRYDYTGNANLIWFFFFIIYLSIRAITISLILHLLLRGFWIATIGLRSVNPNINYDQLKYSDFFQKKLKKKLVGLDQMVVRLDEVCSVIFSVSFLIIFMLLSFGLYFLFIVLLGLIIDATFDFFGIEQGNVSILIVVIIFALLLLTGIIYLVDFFTLGFFKKNRYVSKIYYPIYHIYSFITLSFISRSIYYNLISKYSKKRIRIFLMFILLFLLSSFFIDFDQHQYYSGNDGKFNLTSNCYDDERPMDDYIDKVSIGSKFIKDDFVSLFIRYNARDNERIRSNCPDFEPLRNDGINSKIKLGTGSIFGIDFDFRENDEQLLHCLSELYEVSVNDSLYSNLEYYFFRHPAKDQKGILTVIPTTHFKFGENIIHIKKNYLNSSDSTIVDDFARVPVWFSKN